MLQNYIKIAIKVLLRRKFFTGISLFGISFTLIVLNVTTSMFEKTISNSEVEQHFDRMLVSGEYELTQDDYTYNNRASIAVLNRNFKNFQSAEKQTFYSIPLAQINFSKNKKLVLQRRFVDPEYWKIFNFTFLAGKPFNIKEYDAGERMVVISKYISDVMFDGKALNQYLNVDNNSFKVIGIVENISILSEEAYADLWIPITSLNEKLNGPNIPGRYKVAFLANSNNDFKDIKNEFKSRISNVDLPSRGNKKWEKLQFVLDSKIEKLSRNFSGNINSANLGETIGIIIGMAILFMLLPALNLININISRIMERQSEIGVRKSFGASSSDLVKQFLVENIILSLAGSCIAFIITKLILIQINAMGIHANTTFELNFIVFVSGILFALFFGILSGVLPAYKMAKLNPVNALKGA
jgi:putative ABC transport system permease protein